MLVQISPARSPVGHNDVIFSGHRKPAGENLVQERPEREDVVTTRTASDWPRIGLEAVAPTLQQRRTGVDDIGHVSGVVEQRKLDLVLHENVPRAEATVDDILCMQVAQCVGHLV